MLCAWSAVAHAMFPQAEGGDCAGGAGVHDPINPALPLNKPVSGKDLLASCDAYRQYIPVQLRATAAAGPSVAMGVSRSPLGTETRARDGVAEGANTGLTSMSLRLSLVGGPMAP
eukprot:COSAG04_NODE_2165_length_4644_cov_3.313022_1_plen_114_part_10